jgi:hypothetical protein
MGQNQVITIASFVVSFVKKNKHESPSFLFQLLQNFKISSIVLSDMLIGERFGVLF